MLVGALQVDVRRGAVAANLTAAGRAVALAAEQGARLVVLPELWGTSFPGPGDDLRALAAGGAEASAAAAAWSAEHGLVVVGSHAALASAAEGGAPRLVNRLAIHAGGEVLATYDKAHLFSPTAEHEAFVAGSAPPPVVDTPIGRIAAVVCYDLRFGGLFEGLVGRGVDLLAVPAQWPSPREPHWRALVHGRAVELQCCVVAANRTGREVVGRRALVLEFPGNSLVVDGHGRTLAEGRGEDGFVGAAVDLDEGRRLRVRVPVGKDRRPTLYAAWRAGERPPAG